MQRMPVFVYKQDATQVGSGVYPAIACFCTLGVHVPFSYHYHAGESELQVVGDPTPCDDSCSGQNGAIEDFEAPRSSHDHSVEPIIEKARSFCASSH